MSENQIGDVKIIVNIDEEAEQQQRWFGFNI